MTLRRSPQYMAFSRAVMDEKSLSPLFPVGVCGRGGAVVTNDWCINFSQTLKTCFLVTWLVYWPPHDKTNKMTCALSEDSDQPGHPHEPGHPPSLIRVFAVRSKGSKRPNLSSHGQRSLIRLGGCPG